MAHIGQKRPYGLGAIKQASANHSLPARLPFKASSDFGARIRILDIPRVIATDRRRVPELIKNVFRDIGVVVCPVRFELDAQSTRIGVITDTLDVR
jgi:hypothetical protein